jgi:hypothetical protein
MRTGDGPEHAHHTTDPARRRRCRRRACAGARAGICCGPGTGGLDCRPGAAGQLCRHPALRRLRGHRPHAHTARGRPLSPAPHLPWQTRQSVFGNRTLAPRCRRQAALASRLGCQPVRDRRRRYAAPARPRRPADPLGAELQPAPHGGGRCGGRIAALARRDDLHGRCRQLHRLRQRRALARGHDRRLPGAGARLQAGGHGAGRAAAGRRPRRCWSPSTAVWR